MERATKKERTEVGMPTIKSFYLGEEPYTNGVLLHQVLDANDAWWEKQHDFIQWIFPTKTRSEFNPNAPILTKLDAEFLSQRTVYSIAMLRFEQFLETATTFHNRLRITRAIESITLVLGRSAAEQFLDRVMCETEKKFSSSMPHFQRALFSSWES